MSDMEMFRQSFLQISLRRDTVSNASRTVLLPGPHLRQNYDVQRCAGATNRNVAMRLNR
jgi:hypothetical protein